MTREEAMKLMDLVHDLRSADEDLLDVIWGCDVPSDTSSYEATVQEKEDLFVAAVEALIKE